MQYRGIFPIAIFACLGMTRGHAHLKQLFTGHLYDGCTKASDIVLIKIVTSGVVKIRLVFLTCYLQSLHEIELSH